MASENSEEKTLGGTARMAAYLRHIAPEDSVVQLEAWLIQEHFSGMAEGMKSAIGVLVNFHEDKHVQPTAPQIFRDTLSRKLKQREKMLLKSLIQCLVYCAKVTFEASGGNRDIPQRDDGPDVPVGEAFHKQWEAAAAEHKAETETETETAKEADWVAVNPEEEEEEEVCHSVVPFL
jgi:hypothetical protein